MAARMQWRVLTVMMMMMMMMIMMGMMMMMTGTRQHQSNVLRWMTSSALSLWPPVQQLLCHCRYKAPKHCRVV